MAVNPKFKSMAIILVFAVAVASITTAASSSMPQEKSMEACVKLLFDPSRWPPATLNVIMCRDMLREVAVSFKITGKLSPEYVAALKKLPKFRNNPESLNKFLCGISPAACVKVQVKVKAPPKFSSIRIVRLNGLVEEIEYPITVAEVTGKQPHNHFLFTQAQLLGGAATHLEVDAALEAGRVYFLLPSTLNVSPMELAPIARKLASIAQNTPSKSKSKSLCSSIPTAADADSSSLQQQKYGGKSRSWKPILSTIRERSFNRRSESDLQAEEEHTNINQNTTNKLNRE